MMSITGCFVQGSLAFIVLCINIPAIRQQDIAYFRMSFSGSPVQRGFTVPVCRRNICMVGKQKLAYV